MMIDNQGSIGRTASTCAGHAGASVLAAAVSLVLGTLPAARADTGQPRPEAGGGLEEIVVTATRREVSVQDIPYNISAVSGADIQAAGLTDLTSIARVVPGLQTADLGARAASTNSTFIIRGLNTNDPSTSFIAPNLTVPLVSTYVDEVPLFTNVRLTDIQRIEVLRGPQGTLYGSGSVGGTVRILHNAPTTAGTEFDVTTSVERSAHAAATSEALDSVFNLPLGDRLAWRTSASYERQAGFINANRAVRYGAGQQPVLADPASPLTSNYATGSESGVDDSNAWHVRTALLWKPSDSLSTELALHHEDDRAYGLDAQTPGQPAYTTSTQIPNQPLNRKVDLASLTVTADVGFATLTSASSWYKNVYDDLYDESALETTINSSPAYYGGYPRVSVFNFDHSSDRSFVQEIRLLSKEAGPWDWIDGLYFRDQKQYITDPETMPGFASWSELPGSAAVAQGYGSYFGFPVGATFNNLGDFAQARGALRPSALKPTDLIYDFTRTATYREYAGYGEASYKITPAWQVTGGARVFWEHFSQNVVNELPVCGPSCAQDGVNPLGINTASAERSFQHQIFKFNTSYKLSDETTGYLTVAQGYRHGGANALCTTPTGTFLCYSTAAAAALVPYKSDTAINYELGIKGFGLDRRIEYSTAVFVIDWKDIQLETFSPVTGTTLILNGRQARSQGFEAEIKAQASDNLSVTLGYSFNDSKLTQNFSEASFVGRDGDRLPSVAKDTALVGADYLQPMPGIEDVRFHLDAAYKSAVTTALNDCNVSNSGAARCPAPPSPSGRLVNYGVLGGFTTLNGSATFDVTKQWSVRAYGSNLTNQLGVTAQLKTSPYPRDNFQFVERPRTFGLEAHYQFK